MPKHINSQSSFWCSFAGNSKHILEDAHILLGVVVVHRVEGHMGHVDSRARFREEACMGRDVDSIDDPSLDRMVLEGGNLQVVLMEHWMWKLNLRLMDASRGFVRWFFQHRISLLKE